VESSISGARTGLPSSADMNESAFGVRIMVVVLWLLAVFRMCDTWKCSDMTPEVMDVGTKSGLTSKFKWNWLRRLCVIFSAMDSPTADHHSEFTRKPAYNPVWRGCGHLFRTANHDIGWRYMCCSSIQRTFAELEIRGNGPEPWAVMPTLPVRGPNASKV
jgi:hypothetical protein